VGGGVVGGWFPLAFEHSKVCTLCDFGHLQFIDFSKIDFEPLYVYLVYLQQLFIYSLKCNHYF
jgi:hypothetical protein